MTNLLKPLNTAGPINLCSLPLLKNQKICKRGPVDRVERALDSVGPALTGRGEG